MKKLIWKGEAVCEYEGDLVPHAEGRKQNATTETCFLGFFKLGKKSLCIDATKENCTFGHLINHSHRQGNLKPVACIVRGKPRVVFYAKQDIPPFTELLYDYGERDPLVLAENDWLCW